jgi:cyclase
VTSWETGTVEVAAGVFSYVQAGGGLCISNAGVLTGARETTAIDALFTPAMARTLVGEAWRLAPAPITRLINTHHHVDHTLGNAEFPAETQILAHARAKSEMERAGLGVLPFIERLAPHFKGQLDDAAERLPDVTFDGAALELEASGKRVRLLHFGTGHTRGDVLVYLPAEKVLFTGDLGFFYVTPLGHEGHFGNWIRIGRRVIDEVDADVLVPGHGPPGTKADLSTMLDYLELVHGGAKNAFDAGVTQAEAIESIDLGDYADWEEADRVGANVARCYQEFAGEIDAILT